MTKQNNKLTASSSVWCRFAGGGVTGLVSGARPPAPGEPEPAAEGAGETNSDSSASLYWLERRAAQVWRPLSGVMEL